MERWNNIWSVDLWLNKHQIRQKMHPTVLDRVYPRGRNRTLRPLSFPWESFPFLDLRSVGLSDFAPLSHLATLGQTTALLCQTTCPTSLRSRKVKLSRGKKNWSTFPFCPWDTLCLAVGTIIPTVICQYSELLMTLSCCGYCHQRYWLLPSAVLSTAKLLSET